MKKLLFTLVLGATSLLLSPTSHAQVLPAGATVDFKSVNVSLSNKDAESAGVRPGDVLRYEFTIESQTEDVNGYEAKIDVSQIEKNVDFIDTGLGIRENGFINYPPYSHTAPCKQVFTFFVRFKECSGGVTQLATSAEGETSLVPTTCGGPVVTKKLPSSGPALWALWVFIGIAALYGVSRMMMVQQR